MGQGGVYQESWESGKLTEALVGHTVNAGTQHGENGPLAKKRNAVLASLPIIEPTISKFFLENRDPPVGESALCLAFHLCSRRMVIEAITGPSLAGRLTEAYKPTFTCKPEDRRVSTGHALEVMRSTQLGRKILADVKKGDRLPELK